MNIIFFILLILFSLPLLGLVLLAIGVAIVCLAEKFRNLMVHIHGKFWVWRHPQHARICDSECRDDLGRAFHLITVNGETPKRIGGCVYLLHQQIQLDFLHEQSAYSPDPLTSIPYTLSGNVSFGSCYELIYQTASGDILLEKAAPAKYRPCSRYRI